MKTDKPEIQVHGPSGGDAQSKPDSIAKKFINLRNRSPIKSDPLRITTSISPPISPESSPMASPLSSPPKISPKISPLTLPQNPRRARSMVTTKSTPLATPTPHATTPLSITPLSTPHPTIPQSTGRTSPRSSTSKFTSATLGPPTTTSPLHDKHKPSPSFTRGRETDYISDLSMPTAPLLFQRFPSVDATSGKLNLEKISGIASRAARQLTQAINKKIILKQPLLLKEDELFLHTGAEIALFSIDGSGYVFSDGFMDTSCKLRNSRPNKIAPLDFSECVFQVFPRYKYDAQKCLEDAYTKLGHSPKGTLQNKVEVELLESEEEKISLLKKNFMIEKQENEAEFLRLAGKPVVYGQVVQLKHVKSEKFLTVSIKEAAELETDCFQVLLEESGHDGSWFIIIPRFKMRSEGEMVRMGDQIVMISRKLNVHLHLSQKFARTEVNGSYRLSSWRIIPYSAWNPTSCDFLCAGTPIRLLCEEVDAFITHESLSSVEKQKNNCDELFLEHTSSSNYNSNAIWLIEMDTTMRGGVCTYDKVYRFKHVATGEYLAIESVNSNVGIYFNKSRSSPQLSDIGSSTSVLKMMSSPNSVESSFEICPVDRDQKKRPNDPIRLDSYFTLRHKSTNMWVHAQEEKDNSAEQGNKESKRIRLVVNMSFHDGYVFSLRKVQRHEVEDLYNIKSQLSFLKQYKNQNMSKLSGKDKVSLKSVLRVLQGLRNLCNSKKIQDLLRQQKAIETLLEIVQVITKGIKLEEISQDTHYNKLNISRHVYQLLEKIIKENPKNRLHTSKHFEFIQTQVGHGMSVTSVLLELFRDNPYLLREVTSKEVSEFIWTKLKEEKRFIELLSILTSCNGETLPKNQTYICDKLLTPEYRSYIPFKLIDGTLHISVQKDVWLPLEETNKDSHMSALEYLKLVIELIANLCKGNEAVVANFQKLLDVKSLLEGMKNENLTTSLRAAFCNLLLNLYLSNYKPSPVNLITYTRLWSDMTKQFGPEELSFLERTTASTQDLLLFPIDFPNQMKNFIFDYLKTNVQLKREENCENALSKHVMVFCRHLISYGKFTFEETAELIPLLIGFLRSGSGKTKKGNSDTYGDTSDIVAVKLEGCNILEMTYDYRTNFQLTSLLEFFQLKMKQMVEVKDNFFSDVEGKKALEDTFRILEINSEMYIPLLKELILHNYPPLSIAASNLLERHYSQRSELLSTLKNVHILSDETLVYSYRRISRLLQKTRQTITSLMSKKTVETVCLHLEELINMLEGENRKEHTRILRNLNGHLTAIDVLTTLQKNGISGSATELAFEFLQKFCEDEPDNQVLLFEFSDFFLSFLVDEEEIDVCIKVAEALNAVIAKNYSLCAQVSKATIRHVVNQLRVRKILQYLEFLHNIVDVNGKLIRRNQILVAQLLVEKADEVLITYVDPHSIRRRNLLIQQSEFTKNDSELLFHVKLVDLMCVCCKEKIYESEIKMQSVVSIDDALAQVHDTDNLPLIRGAFLSLFYEV